MARNTPIVRPATADDCAAIADLTPTTSPPPSRRSTPSRSTSTSGSRNFAAITGADRPFLVAVDDKRIVGYAYLGGYNPKPAYRQTVRTPSTSHRGGNSAQGRQRTDVRSAGGLRGHRRSRDRRAHRPARRRVDHCTAATVSSEVGVLRQVGFKFGQWIDVAILQCSVAVGSLGAGLGSVGGISSSVDALRVV